MHINIRKIKINEYKVLDDFLYEAIFIPKGVEAPPREIINTPELQVYVQDFGKREGDICFVAEAEEESCHMYLQSKEYSGASSKDAGKKLCAINVIADTSMIHSVIDKLQLAPDKQI